MLEKILGTSFWLSSSEDHGRCSPTASFLPSREAQKMSQLLSKRLPGGLFAVCWTSGFWFLIARLPAFIGDRVVLVVVKRCKLYLQVVVLQIYM